MNKNKFSKFSRLFVGGAIALSILLWSCAQEDITEEEDTSIIKQALPCWALWCPAKDGVPTGPNPQYPTPAPAPGGSPNNPTPP